IGNSELQTLGPVRVKVSSCRVPFVSQHPSFTQDGLLRITLVAYESRVASAPMFSSHSLWARNASCAMFTPAAPRRGVSQFTSLAVVPFAFFSRSSLANVRI